jgi:hypothetical protein
VSSSDGAADSAWSVLCRRDWWWMANLALWRRDGIPEMLTGEFHPEHATWGASQGGAPLDGMPAFDMHLALRKFKPVGTIGHYCVFRYVDAIPRYHTVSRAYVAPDEDAAWNAVLRKGFSAAQWVVLEHVDASLQRLPDEAPDANEPVEVQSEDHESIRLKTTRKEAGWLVYAQPWYPGWKARVNGVETPIVRANYAFSAVRLPAGESTIALDYEPASVRIGAWASCASLLTLAAWMFASRRHAG